MSDEKKGEGESRCGQAVSNAMAMAGIEGIVEKFSATDKTLSSAKYLQDIDDYAELFGWTPNQKLIVARRNLTGTAELWIKTEKVFKTYEDLRTALIKEFPDAVNVKELHEFMSTRKKRKDETYYEYMLVMKEYGKRGRLADYITIQYIVDGIVDHEANKAILYGVTTYPVLKDKLAIYENMKKVVIKKKQDSGETDYSSRNNDFRRRCYKCGEKNHLASACRNGVKCYKCNNFGHIATRCNNTQKFQEAEHHAGAVSEKKQHEETYRQDGGPSSSRTTKWQPRTMCMKSERDLFVRDVGISAERYCESTVNVKDGGASAGSDKSCQFNVNKLCTSNKSVKLIEICGVKVESLIDSGSDLNLITSDLFFELNLTSYVKEKVQFSGLGSIKVDSLGKTECDLKLDGHCFRCKFYIVPKDVLPYGIILGQPFLRCTVLVFDKGSVNILSQENSGLLNCLIAEAVDEPSIHVPDEQIKSEVQILVKNYSPEQIMEAPFEMHIVMKDDIPVAQRPRRLAITEQREVDKQVSEWLQKGIIKPSYSEYASPLVLVKKKSGETRVCVDYRKVNAKMVKDEFPLPITIFLDIATFRLDAKVCNGDASNKVRL